MSIRNTILKKKLISAGAFDRPSSLIKLVAVILMPFVFLAISGREPNNVPWHFLVMALMLLLSVLVVGFFMFTWESHAAEDISISPDKR